MLYISHIQILIYIGIFDKRKFEQKVAHPIRKEHSLFSSCLFLNIAKRLEEKVKNTIFYDIKIT